MIRIIPQGVWIVLHCLITHSLRFEVITDIPQGVWIVLHCFITHLLGPKTIWYNFRTPGFLRAASLHISLILRVLGTNAKERGLI